MVKAALNMTTIVREMKPNDIDEAKLFLREHFIKHEPILNSPGIELPQTSNDPNRRDYHASVIRQGCSLIVVDRSNNDRIVGVAFAEELTDTDLKQNWIKLNEKKQSQQPVDHIDYFLCNIKRNAQFFKHYGASRALYLQSIAVDASMRRQGLGRRLVTELIEVGRSKGFLLLVATCTGVYSTRLMESIGMKCEHSEPYSEFKDNDGKVVFKPPAPHIKASVMVMKLL